MNKLAVSVIIPIYNAEKYLTRCLDSLLGQTMENYEVIAVDDCSNDASNSILKAYLQKSDKLKLIENNKNIGASESRNKAIKEAKGEYIAFVDSDDYVEPVFLEHMYENAVATKSDISICNYFIKLDEKKRRKRKKYNVKKGIYKNPTALRTLIYDTNIHYYVWNKFFRRELIFDNDITFPDMCFEDTEFTVKAFFYANQIAVINETLYTYVKHQDSSVASIDRKKLDEYVKAIEITRCFLENQNAFRNYKFSFLIHSLRIWFSSLPHILRFYKEDKNLKIMIADMKNLTHRVIKCNKKETDNFGKKE